MYMLTNTYESRVSVWRLRLIYIQYKPYYTIYWLCLWPIWPLSLWFHFLIKFLFMWMFICCGQNQYFAYECLWFIFIFYTFMSQLFDVISWFSTCISLMIDYLLVDETFKPKNYKNKFHFSFNCLEIVLACSLVF